MPDNLERPRRYFGLHYRMLRFLGLGWWHHPDEKDLENFRGWYIVYSAIAMSVWVVGFVGLETIDPFTGDKDLDRFMLSLSFVVTHNLTLVKLYLFFFRNKNLQRIVNTLEVDLYEYYQNDARNRATVRSSRILTGAFLFFGWATIGNSTINGAVQDFQWRAIIKSLNETQEPPERSLPQPVFIPWKTQEDGPYILAFTLEAVGLLWTGHIVMIIDTFIGTILLHMSGQFVILQEAFTNLYSDTLASFEKQIGGRRRGGGRELDHARAATYEFSQTPHAVIVTDDIDKREDVIRKFFTNKEIEDALDARLVECIRQHQLLISCVEYFERTYTYGFLTQLASSLAAICVIMVQVSNDVSSFKSIRFATSLAFFCTMITQLAIQCFSANEVTLQGVRVAECAAHCGWERAHAGFRRTLVLVLLRAQRPLAITAGGYTTMSNSCFLAIVKAAYSYYAVLQQQS